MKLFESEGWKSFRLNSLAVILGVVITFGGGRLITNCQKRQDAREIVGLFKSDVLRHLDMSEGVIADLPPHPAAGSWTRCTKIRSAAP